MAASDGSGRDPPNRTGRAGGPARTEFSRRSAPLLRHAWFRSGMNHLERDRRCPENSAITRRVIRQSSVPTPSGSRDADHGPIARSLLNRRYRGGASARSSFVIPRAWPDPSQDFESEGRGFNSLLALFPGGFSTVCRHGSKPRAEASVVGAHSVENPAAGRVNSVRAAAYQCECALAHPIPRQNGGGEA